MKKLISIGIVTFFIGCGGGSSSSSSNTISGKVVDGYVKGAKVCLDINNNFRCDENEPFTISDENGNYTLESDGKEHILISLGGIDTENNIPAIKMYSSTKYKNITPLTSLAIKEGEEKVAEFFNISVSDIAKDPMKDNEIKNIVKDIVNNFLANGKYELPNTFTFVDIKTPNTSNESEINLEENNQSEEIQTANVTQKEGDENIPPAVIGNLTPPSIGE